MSWIVGIVGDSIPIDLLNNVKSLYPPPLYTINTPGKFFLAAGGNTETLHCHTDHSGATIVAGCGISMFNDTSHILASQDWNTLFSGETVSLQDLNGNFVAIRYRNSVFECFSDRVGLRTLYFGNTGSGWVFSSKLSWVCRLLPETTIDWNVFGARWISFNQLSFSSPVRHVHRLPPNGHAVIRNAHLTLNSTPWIDGTTEESTPESVRSILYALTAIPDKHIRIGLSGGLDSRTLLSIVAARTKNFSAYSFGSEDEPDIQSARRICAALNIPFGLHTAPLPPRDECIKLVNDYVHQSNLVGSASMAVKLRYYPMMSVPKSVQIDGGGGEVARRQLLNRLSVLAPGDVKRLDAKNIIRYLTVHRSDIFNKETATIMYDGAIAELDQLIHSLPSPSRIGLENFLDRWAATVVIPNVACDEHARIDEYILNFMPFSQPSFMESVIRLPLRYRTNNRLFKDIISQSTPLLSRFPLIKNNVPYPYRMSMLQMRVWTKILSVLRATYVDRTPTAFLDSIEEYVRDTVHSSKTRAYPYYDYAKVLSLVERYYNGERHLSGDVNWWLAFDVWRRGVEK